MLLITFKNGNIVADLHLNTPRFILVVLVKFFYEFGELFYKYCIIFLDLFLIKVIKVSV
jgi:hypothetical protein